MDAFPQLDRPMTREEALAQAERLTGAFWHTFSPPLPTPKSTWGLRGGQVFLGLRIKGNEYAIAQALCWLCGQRVITPRELIIALGRQPVESARGLEERVSGKVQSSPAVELVDRINAFGVELYPITKYAKKGARFYDRELPPASSLPYLYVIEDELRDVKIGISIDPRNRFRQIETYETTTIEQFRVYGPAVATRDIEQALLRYFGSGQHPAKRSREWLFGRTFSEVIDRIEADGLLRLRASAAAWLARNAG